MRIKPKIKSNKLNSNPLFIKFLNWQGDKYRIEFFFESLIENFEDDLSKKIVKDKILDDLYLNSLITFKNQFKKYIDLLIATHTLNEEFLMWLNNAYKYISEEEFHKDKEEVRKIKIKDADGRWFESIICYNFILTFNYFGAAIIKKCPICNSYFSHKTKYAKYCSDNCLEKGKKK